LEPKKTQFPFSLTTYWRGGMERERERERKKRKKEET
jgi:hypothetical protein